MAAAAQMKAVVGSEQAGQACFEALKRLAASVP